jgi:hypothetical protein
MIQSPSGEVPPAGGATFPNTPQAKQFEKIIPEIGQFRYPVKHVSKFVFNLLSGFLYESSHLSFEYCVVLR